MPPYLCDCVEHAPPGFSIYTLIAAILLGYIIAFINFVYESQNAVAPPQNFPQNNGEIYEELLRTRRIVIDMKGQISRSWTAIMGLLFLIWLGLIKIGLPSPTVKNEL
jgi:hypothetical protein